MTIHKNQIGRQMMYNLNQYKVMNDFSAHLQCKIGVLFYKSCGYLYLLKINTFVYLGLKHGLFSDLKIKFKSNCN